MRLNLPDTAASAIGQAGVHFAQAVGRRSNGQLTIEVYPSGQLLPQQNTVDGLANGIIDFGIISSAFLVPIFPQYQVFDLPFLLRNLTSGYRLLDGAIGNEFFGLLGSKGVIGLGWGTSGFRELQTTTRAVTVPDDMKGLRIRILAGAVYVATYQALGAIPVTIDMSETFAALNQHAVDGMDINLDSFAVGKFYTVCRHVAMMHHIFSVIPLLGSKRKIESLPAALQKIVREEGNNAVRAWRKDNEERIAGDVDLVKKNGVAFTEIQYAPFRKAMDPVYAGVAAKVGIDLIERVTRAANG